MSEKPMKAAHGRGMGHGKNCPLCNPRKKLKAYQERKAPLSELKRTPGKADDE